MTPIENEKLEEEFEKRLSSLILQWQEIGYTNPSIFIDMLQKYGAKETAIRLISDKNLKIDNKTGLPIFQSGFIEIAVHLGHIDLTVEYIMTHEFPDLFRADYLESASWRLQQIESGNFSIKKIHKFKN